MISPGRMVELRRFPRFEENNNKNQWHGVMFLILLEATCVCLLMWMENKWSIKKR